MIKKTCRKTISMLKTAIRANWSNSTFCITMVLKCLSVLKVLWFNVKLFWFDSYFKNIKTKKSMFILH